MVSIARHATMTLFSNPGCHYSHRVRIALAEKGVAYDLEEYTPETAPTELADYNPYLSFPTLVDRDLSLYDSRVILEYLDERYPHPPLLPIYPDARAHSRQVMFQIERDWSGKVDRLVEAAGQKSAALSKERKELAQGILAISGEFVDRQFFGGEEFSLVDCVLAPIFWRLGMMGINLPRNRQTAPLLDYMERVFRRPSFQLSLSALERDMPNLR